MSKRILLLFGLIPVVLAIGWGVLLKRVPRIKPSTQIVSPIDGAPMSLIPVGEFQMGSTEGLEDEKPAHTVYLNTFYIDKHEVTNAMYRKFMEATGHWEPKYWNNPAFNQPQQPVVGVMWYDAMAYAQWVGRRLPTEAEWEKAARGGLVSTRHIWGNTTIPPKGGGNFADETAKKKYQTWAIFTGYNDGYIYPAPVGRFSPNGYGLHDMAGNVWEWCLDEYDKQFYTQSPRENPIAGEEITSLDYPFTAVKVSRVVRGGSWVDSTRSLRTAERGRSDPTKPSRLIGFRCAKSVEP